MKKILTSLLCVGFLSASAQYYIVPRADVHQNPRQMNDDPEQTFGILNPLGWTTIHTQTASVSPIWSSNVNLPFSFNFNGVSYTSCQISTNGLLTFSVNPPNPSASIGSLPDMSVPDNTIVMSGIDIHGSNDAVLTKTFGTAPNRQFWVLYSSASVPGVSIQHWSYWSIVLEESTNKIYVVDQRTFFNGGGNLTNMNIGLQFSTTNALSVPGSPNILSKVPNGGNPDTQDDNSYYEFIPGSTPTYDIDPLRVNMPIETGLSAGAVNIAGFVFNSGSATVSNYELSYSVNGGTPVTATINANISQNAFTSFTHPTAWTPPTDGTYEIMVWTGDVNGNADEDPYGDTVKHTIVVFDATAPRFTLLESFTSSTCGPCAQPNAQFHALLPQIIDNCVVIKYQQNFPGAGDPYSTAESVSRRSNFYQITGIPRMEIDGQWDSHTGSFTKAVFDQYNSKVAFVNLEIAFKVTGQKVDGLLYVTPLADISGNHTLYIAIVEKETSNNARTNGETKFYDVMKKMLPGVNGQPVASLMKNQTQTFNFSHEFMGNYREPNSASDPINHSIEHSVEDFGDLEVVAWLQNNSTKEVANANSASKTIGLVNYDKLPFAVMAFPNPANDVLNIEYATKNPNTNLTFELVNMMGQSVAKGNLANQGEGTHYHNLNVAGYSAGMYMLIVSDGEKRMTQKVSIR